MDEPLKIEQRQKIAIIGNAGMVNYEKMMKPTDKVILFHWEKREEVYQEILHHFGFTSITSASCGRLPLFKACIRSNVKCLGLCRNATHVNLSSVNCWRGCSKQACQIPLRPTTSAGLR
jgi:hypothetical protein